MISFNSSERDFIKFFENTDSPGLKDLLDSKAVQELMDDFYSLTGIGIGILDLKGRILIATGSQEVCLNFHRANDESCRNCLETYLYLYRHMKAGEYNLHRCNNNMYEMVAPIYVSDNMVGNIFLNNFFFDDEEPDIETFICQAEQYGYDKKEYLAALDRVPRFSRNKINTAMQFYTKFASLISQLLTSNLHYGRTLADNSRVQNELKFALKQLKFHFDNTPLAIIVFNNEYRVIKWSRRAEATFGWSADEILGKKIDEIKWVHEDDKERVARLSAEMLAAKNTSNIHINRNYTKDGRILTCEWYNSALIDSDGNMVSVQSLVLDITEKQEAEVKLKEMIAALERSNSDLEQFAYISAHDLQEPLRMVSNFTQLLSRQYRNVLDYKAIGYMDFITEGAKRMHTLIKDLLEYSRITTQANAFTQTDCQRIITDVVSDLSLIIRETGANIYYGTLPVIYADATQIRQLFQNLIGNAIKFHNSEPPVIHISAECRNNEWLFSVADNGIGIDPMYFKQIFLAFHRLNDREKYPGNGIGLAICKKIVERHGGQIWVESNDKGCTFYFTMPVNPNSDTGTVV